MIMFMRVFLLEAPGLAVMKELPLRDLKPDEILIKVQYSGICGTDLSFYTGKSDFVRRGLVRYPVRIGHEWSGTVERIGEAVTAFSEGDNVVADNGVACGECESCREGKWTDCRSGYSVGTINCWDGCFADYIIMPERHVFLLKEGLSLLDACLIEPATISYNALKRRDVVGKTVLIIGTGPIGLSAIPFAKEMGAARVLLLGRTRSKLDIGLAMGADRVISSYEEDPMDVLHDIAPGGVDLVLEASGVLDNIWLAVRVTRQFGSVALLAFYETEIGGIGVEEFIEREVDLYGVMGAFGLAGEVAELMAKRGIDLKPMITQTIGFDELPEVFTHASEMKDRVKIVVDMNRTEI